MEAHVAPLRKRLLDAEFEILEMRANNRKSEAQVQDLTLSNRRANGEIQKLKWSSLTTEARHLRLAETLLSSAVTLGDSGTVRQLLSATSLPVDFMHEGHCGAATMLCRASSLGHYEVVEYLLGQGADVHFLGMNAQPPLYIASCAGHTQVVAILLRHGACTHFCHIDGTASLHAASYRGFTRIVELLLAGGAYVNQLIAGSRMTALYIASQEGRSKVVETLLEHGANANLGDGSGRTPLFTASQEGHVEIVGMLLDKGAYVNQATTDDGMTALYSACEEGHLNVVKKLLEHGASPNYQTSDFGASALYIASQNGFACVAELLIDKGACVEKAVTDGRSPLHTAAYKGCEKVVRVLLAAGAKIWDESQEAAALDVTDESFSRATVLSMKQCIDARRSPCGLLAFARTEVERTIQLASEEGRLSEICPPLPPGPPPGATRGDVAELAPNAAPSSQAPPTDSRT